MLSRNNLSLPHIYSSSPRTTHSPSEKSPFLFLSLFIFIFSLFLLFLACPTHQVYAATSHYIEVMTTKANLFPGDTLRLYASAENNSGQEIYGDVFLGLIAPGGEIYFFDPSLNLLPCDESDPKTFTPFAENVNLPTGFILPPTEFFSVELPDYVPEGTWTAFAALTEPGSTKSGSVRLIGDISLAEIKFSKIEGPTFDATGVDEDGLIVSIGSSSFIPPSISVMVTKSVKSTNLIDAAQVLLEEVPWISQIPPCTDWFKTANCGPTSYLMVESFYKGYPLNPENSEGKIKESINPTTIVG